MGRRSLSGGVCAAGRDRVQFTFVFEGIRYRPTLPWTPTEANLRRARQHLIGIKTRIRAGTFSFAEEFPDYRRIKKVPRCGSPRTCDQVFDEYLAHCSARVARHDMAPVTLTSYRKILDGTWRPKLGPLRLLDVRYSTLVLIADRAQWCKKSHNNAISVLRRAFEFGYRDHPERCNPTRGLKGARIQQKDRPHIDPFTLDEAEALIAAIRRDWGDAQANYDEFRFFTGLRSSEEIALLVSDYDAARGTLDVTRARVNGVDKDSTKTGNDRRIVLCPRAVGVLNRHLALREELVRAGNIDHDFLFFKASGRPLRNLLYPGMRWHRSLTGLKDVRYRRPYTARHTSVSWDLMIGRSALWVARQHGHSIATMLRFYAAWADGAPESDVGRIRATLYSEDPLRRRPMIASQGKPSRSIARPFEMEFPPGRFATGFATERSQSVAKSLNKNEEDWRRERDSNPRRAYDPYTLSRGAPSTTRPPLRALGNACVSACLAGGEPGWPACGAAMILKGPARGKALQRSPAQALSRARTYSCTDSSASSSASGLLPPACAKSARPPPRPPTCAATAPASSPALMREV
jgi:integrase